MSKPSSPVVPLCVRCGERPVLPSRRSQTRGHHQCCRCHEWYNRASQKRKWSSVRYRAWNKERMYAQRNPRRAAYRVIGLEAFNLAMGRQWNGKARRHKD